MAKKPSKQPSYVVTLNLKFTLNRMGNEHIFMLTRNDDFELRVELDDFDGNRR